MNSLISKYLGVVIRAGIIWLGAKLVDHQMVGQADIDAVLGPLTQVLVGVAAALIAIGWSFIQKWAQEQLFHTALKLPAKAKPEDAATAVKEGWGALVSALGKVS